MLPSPLSPPRSRTEQSILGTLLFKQFNRGVLESSCDALHSLMWCENEQFQTLMSQVRSLSPFFFFATTVPSPHSSSFSSTSPTHPHHHHLNPTP